MDLEKIKCQFLEDSKLETLPLQSLRLRFPAEIFHRGRSGRGVEPEMNRTSRVWSFCCSGVSPFSKRTRKLEYRNETV